MITERVETHLASLSLQPILCEWIKVEQKPSDEGKEILKAMKFGQRKDLIIDEEGSIWFGDRL